MRKQIPNSVLPRLWDDLSMRPYLGEVRRRHGIVETLALPAMRDLPPLRIETLFVSPMLSEKPVSADSDPKSWPAGKGLLETLNKYPQLVVLGDPGGGKTTLSNWLAWRLSAGLAEPLIPLLDDCVPLPCVLREMPASVFSSNITLSDLAETIAVRLLGNQADNALKTSLRSRIEAGRYVLILDGVDEIPVPHRKVVADWIANAHEQNACVLATSRIVGYEDGPVDFSIHESIGLTDAVEANITDHSDEIDFSSLEKKSHLKSSLKYDVRELRSEHKQTLLHKEVKIREAEIRYLMPFNQSRIAAFAENWYRQRCATEQDAQEKASDLLVSLSQSDAIRQLARTPNLLSLMAIVHRERAHLPDGKALLYEEIANAYINTIDKQRKIEPGDTLVHHTWKDRKSWLAYVGFEMQKQRDNAQDEGSDSDSGVLASEKDVLKWLIIAMKDSGVEQPEKSAQTFLYWVARRSGLLLPRGDKRFAFVHLSFQEYFCACYLDARIASRAFIHNKLKDSDPVTRKKMSTWSEHALWRETLVYLFELQSAEREQDWVDDLAEILFDIDGNNKQLISEKAALAARVLSDRHIRLGEETKDALASRCCQRAIEEWELRDLEIDKLVLPALLVSGYAAIVGASSVRTDDSEESLLPTIKLTDLKNLETKSRIRLCIINNKNIKNTLPLSEIGGVKFLILNNTKVTNIKPLAKLKNLENLALNDTDVKDITPLSQLSNLVSIGLDGTKVTDIAPLSQLSNLASIRLDGTKVTDITPLAQLKNLKALTISHTLVSDLTPLCQLDKLEFLQFDDTQVTDISPLTKLNKLEILTFNDTPVADIKSLNKLNKLMLLIMRRTQVVDITPLAKLKELIIVDMGDTRVADIKPLSKLHKLVHINLRGTQVASIMPLVEHKDLRSLDIRSTKVSDSSLLSGRNALKIRQ